MKTYEELFVETVLREMDGLSVSDSVITGGAFGGVPYIFYDSEIDVTELFAKRVRRTRAQKDADEEMSPEEYEYRFMKTMGLADDSRNKIHYSNVKRRINDGNRRFTIYLKRFKECRNDSERASVARGVICDIKTIIRMGCSSPSDYVFLRRFGLYA